MKTIVVDTAHPLGKKNRCFDSSIENNGLGLALFVRFARVARQHGWEVMTTDEFLELKEKRENSFLITDMYSPITNLLLTKKIIPFICFSLESPLIAQKFYHNIMYYAGRFRYSYQFSATQNRLKDTKTKFKSLVFPVETRKQQQLIPWAERKYLVVVNSNKRALNHNFKNIKESLTSLVLEVRSKFWRFTDPLLRLKELYIERIEAIRYFSDKPGFNLYGFGWNDSIQGFSKPYNDAVQKC